MNEINVIPQPVLINQTGNFLKLDGNTVCTGDSLFSHEIELANQQFGVTKNNGNSPLCIVCTHSPVISEKEGYEISISQKGIEIRSGHTEGMYHGIQSIRQLILAAKQDTTLLIPYAEIKDYPRFAWRGCMLDSSRHFYSVSFIKKLIDIISLHHMNVFHWHLTDDQGWRLPVEGYPKLTEIGAFRIDQRTPFEKAVGGFYSFDEIREIVAYAAARHIDVVPEIDLPGHASAILASYPEMGCTGGPYQVEDRFGIFDDVLCAGNDTIFDLFNAVFDTLIDLFPSRYVHIGGDEVKFNRWEACPKCQSRMKELNLQKPQHLQSWVTMRLVQMLQDRKRIAIGWDEVLEIPENAVLPQDLIIMSWRGREGGIEATAKGLFVIMTAMSDGCYLNFKHLDNAEEPGRLGTATVRQSWQMEPIVPEMTKAQAAFVLGGQCNLWSEAIEASKIAEYLLFPRLCAISEALWSAKESKDFKSFENRLSLHQKKLDALDVIQYRGALE